MLLLETNKVICVEYACIFNKDHYAWDTRSLLNAGIEPSFQDIELVSLDIQSIYDVHLEYLCYT